jgi:hypothetical protein
MIRALVKLALAALIVNAAWRVGSAYATHLKFRDAVREAATYDLSGEADLRQKILNLAEQFDIPLDDDALKIKIEDQQTIVEGSYVRPIQLLPSYEYPWPFQLTIEAIRDVKPSSLQDLKRLAAPPPRSP